MPSELTFDLARFKTSAVSRIFSGRPRGEECRAEMQLDAHDHARDIVNIIIPNDIFSINMSFFLGLFGRSVRHYKTVDSFLDHYRFQGPKVHLRAISEYAHEALKFSMALPEKKTA